MRQLFANVARDLFILAVLLFTVALVGIKYLSQSLTILAAIVVPFMLLLGLVSGCGLTGAYSKWMRIVCVAILAGFLAFIFYVLRSGGAQGGVGIMLASYIIGVCFLLIVIIVWVVYGIHRLRGT